jgi:hypothetical protein
MWGLFSRVMIPSQEAAAAVVNRPRGNFSDLYPRWLGARELFIHQRNPYGSDLTAEIQRGYWGHEVDSGNPAHPKDQAGFAYPLYVVFVLAPTILLPFEVVQVLYVILGIAMTVASLRLWCEAFDFSPRPQLFAAGAVLLTGSYPVVQALYLQQPVLIVAALLAAAFAFIARGALWSAGFVLAWAMIKPQVTLPLAAWLMLWSLARWKQRRALALSFGATMAFLFIASERLLPGWLWEWRAAVAAYSRYAAATPSHLEIFFGQTGGFLVSAALIIIVSALCWRARLALPDDGRFKLVAPLILASILVLNPLWREYDVLLLLPAALLLIGKLAGEEQALWPFEKAFIPVALGLLAWQWPAALGVFAMSFPAPGVAPDWLILPWLSLIYAPLPLVVSLLFVARTQITMGSEVRGVHGDASGKSVFTGHNAR